MGRKTRGWTSRSLGVSLAVFAGGCAGGAARYAEVRAWPTGSSGFPASTLVVNLAGAFALAAFVTWADHAGHGRWPRAVIGSGFCGAYTTFSAIVVDADRLLAHGRIGLAAAYVAASFAGGAAAVVLGMAVSDRVHRLLRPPMPS